MTASHRDKLSGYSSVFDERLRRNRERMNEKMQGFSRHGKYSPEYTPEYSPETPTGLSPAASRYIPVHTPLEPREESAPPRNVSPPVTKFPKAPSRPPTALTPPAPPRGTRPAAATLPAASPPRGEGARLLTARFGGKWLHEITERRLESGEAVVVCRVTVPEEGLAQTHTGRAKIPAATRPGPGKEALPIQGAVAIPGAADGIPFTIRLDSGSNGRYGNGEGGGATEDAEEAAFQAALGEALLECARSFRNR